MKMNRNRKKDKMPSTHKVKYSKNYVMMKHVACVGK